MSGSIEWKDRFSEYLPKIKGLGGGKCLECWMDPRMEGMVCSPRCAQNLWISVQESYAKATGKYICRFPGCHKECFVEIESGRKHDYCSRGHVEIHQQQLQEIYQYTTGIKKCKQPGCYKLCYFDNYGKVFDYCCERHKQMTIPCSCEECKKKKSPILFYESFQPYYEFSNFYKFAPFELDDGTWKSAEHYFQAQKFIGTPYFEHIRDKVATPREAFQLSREHHVLKWQRSDWEEVKLLIMRKALLAKFIAHERLRALLLSTSDRKLVEHTYNDRYWGDGGDGSGYNHLGQLLMEIRKLIIHKGTTV